MKTSSPTTNEPNRLERQLNRRGVLLALIVSLALGGCTLWDRLWGDDERPVTLLSEQVTLGPEPLVIQAPKGTSASGTSFWLTVYLARPKVCEGSKWAKEEAERLPTIHAVAVTSDGHRHPMPASACCAASTCGALTLNARIDSEGTRRLSRLLLSAPEPLPIERVIWASWESEIHHLNR